MSMGINSLLSNVDDKMKMFRANPEQAMQRAKMTGSTLDAIAAEKVLSEKQAAANELSRQLVPDENTIAGQTDQALQGMAVQELAEGIGKVFQVNQARKQKNLNKVASMGLAGAPVQRKMAMANGGIVGYQAGNTVFKNDPYGTPRGRRLQEIMQMDISPEEKRKLLEEEQVMTSGPGIPVRQIAPATVNRPELTPTISPGTELSGLDVLSENLLAENQMSAAMTPKSDQTIVEQAASEQPVTGADMFKTTPVLDVQAEEAEEAVKELPTVKEQEKSPALTPTQADDPPEEKTRKKNAYNEWFERLLTVLSAPPTGRGLGGGNVARAYVQFSQRVIDNFNDALTLEIEEDKVKAAKKFNELKAQGMNDAKLMALKEDYVNQIRQIRDKANTSTVALRLEGDKNKLIELQTKDSPDTNAINALKARIRAAERTIEMGIKQQTKMQIAEIEAIDQILRGSIKGLPSLTTGGSGVPQGFQNKANVVQGP